MEKIGISDGQTRERLEDYLKEAKKHPTSLSHQVYGQMQAGNGAFAAAFDEFKQAIALDPSDSWSYADMASSLVRSGRPAEAIPYLQTAMRVDPSYPPQYSFILGTAQFDLNQFQAAAYSLESATGRNSRFADPLVFLISAYGYLNRKQEAIAALATLNQLRGQQGHGPLTRAAAPAYVNFTESADSDRLREGLRLAGVPAY